MKRSERLSKSLNRLMIVWAIAALVSVATATKMQGHQEQQGVISLIAAQ